MTHSRSETHEKITSHGTAKKSDVHKSRTNKQSKTEHNKNDLNKGGPTGTRVLFSVDGCLTYETVTKSRRFF